MTAEQVLFLPTAILGYGITPVLFVWGVETLGTTSETQNLHISF